MKSSSRMCEKQGSDCQQTNLDAFTHIQSLAHNAEASIKASKKFLWTIPRISLHTVITHCRNDFVVLRSIHGIPQHSTGTLPSRKQVWQQRFKRLNHVGAELAYDYLKNRKTHLWREKLKEIGFWNNVIVE